MHPFTALFLAAVALSIGLRLFLAYRQYWDVRAHRESVPEAFSDQISLDAHRKAADYTCAKTKLGVVAILVDALILIVLTLGGGLNFGHEIASTFFDADILRGIALVGMDEDDALIAPDVRPFEPRHFRRAKSREQTD